MFTSFSTALSGLKANTTAIDVMGNNLANLNTTGFKTSDVTFEDLMSESLSNGPGAAQIGFGVSTPSTLLNFSQGAIQSTGGALDAAIQGDGFFVDQSASGTIGYTRNGTFQVNSNGQLSTTTGQLVQGWSATNGTVNTNAPTGPITVPVGSLAAAQATQTTSVDLNLDASATTGATNGTFSTSVQVYDSLGISHVATFAFTKTATANQWNYSASIPATDTTAPSTPVTGTLTFDTNGNLTSPAAGAAQPVIAATGLVDGAAALNITWNLYNGTTPRITQFAQTSATSAVAQNGVPAANLVSIGIANGGQIFAKYSSGQQTVVGQIAMASIRNPESLIAVGNSNFEVSALTAAPTIGLPGTGGRGTVVAGSVESSNADIAKEFTDLIVYQRGYEANAKVITAVDQLSQATINLKQ